jgi:hypothetical protein
MDMLGGETETIDRRLIAAASGSADPGAIANLHKRRAEIVARVEAIEQRWYELHEALSTLEQA